MDEGPPAENAHKAIVTPDLVNLQPFITEEARRLAAKRLGMTDQKVALLIVKAVNPYEVLTQEEEAILRGVSRDKLRGHKERKELPHVL